jgi:hypothetical protein
MAESGLAGIIQGPALDFSPIQQFGQQLIAARDRQRAADEASMQTAIQIAQYDPSLAEQIGGKAMGRLFKDKGAGRSSDFFKAIGTEAEQKRSQQMQLFQAQLAQSQAATQASIAGTEKTRAEIPGLQAEGRLKVLQADTEKMTQDAEQRIATKGDYPERTQDATFVAIHRGLSADLLDKMELTPDQLKQVQQEARDYQKALHAKVNVDLATALATKVIVDPRTGKPRPLNATEVNQAMAGQPVAGLSTGELQNEAIRIGIERINADANFMRAKHEAALTDIQIKDYEAKAELDLAHAEALRKQGIKTSYDDVLKTFEAFRQAKLEGRPVDPSLRQYVEDQLAAFYGLEPKEVKGWLGRIERAGYVLRGAEQQKPAAPTGEPEPTAGARLGTFMRQLPGQAGTFAATAGQTAESQTLDFITALAGGQTGPATVTKDIMVGGKKVPAGSTILRTITGTYYVTPTGEEIQQPGTPRLVPNP